MSLKPISDNTLFYGDNLPILGEHVPDEERTVAAKRCNKRVPRAEGAD